MPVYKLVSAILISDA